MMAVDIPESFFIPNDLWMRGLRKSVSTRRTRAPACAIVMAKLIAAVVFPSRGPGLVTPKTRTSFCAERNIKFVRMDLHASAA
jgi:hypothetical protein